MLAYRSLVILVAIAVSIVGTGCSPDEPAPTPKNVEIQPCDQASTMPYTFDLPAHFPPFIVSNNNLTTVEGAALGRRLYYDDRLSAGGPLRGKSCSSCHPQSKSFSNNAPGTSVLPHTNLNWSSYFLWNGEISGGIEEAMMFEVVDFFQTNITLIKADKTYQRMSCEAFGTSDISEREMANALAQWMRTLISHDSKYDRYIAGIEQLTTQELRGEEIFNSVGDCFKCHTMPLTTDLMFHNNGIELAPTGKDMGRFNVTGDPADMGKFKTPTLRNVALTAPYMHDGRFETLEQVVDHYDSRVIFSDTLDSVMVVPGNVYTLGLSRNEKEALVAFLKTFTDTTFITSPKFSDPFK